MNKKGFVLAEAIIVAVFVLGMFTYLAMNIFPLITKYDQANNYDNPNEIYLVNTLYDELIAANKFDSLADGIYNFSKDVANVKVTDKDGVEITVKSDVFAKGVNIDFGKYDCVLSDNFFDLANKEPYVIKVETEYSAKELKDDMKVMSVYDIGR